MSSPHPGQSEVSIPAGRWARWVENFERGHGATDLFVREGGLAGHADDGSWFMARLPFGADYAGLAASAGFADAVGVPEVWGVLLVRKGGFAVARLESGRTVESKVGQRHVQGRTKAGGQSQQRFARRRDNQARQAYEAAAGHAARILATSSVVVTGGDHAAVDAVLGDSRLGHVVVTPPWLAVPDPRRGVLEQAVLDAQSLRVEVHNA